MANALFPEALNGQASVNEAHAILDQMIANGNKIAMVRKDELAYVENLFLEVAARAESNGLQPLSLSTAVDEESGPAHNIRSAIEGEKIMNQKSVDELLSGDLLHPEYPPSPCTADFPMPSTELLDDIGISSAEFLAIVDQIGNPENSYSVLDLRNEHGIF